MVTFPVTNGVTTRLPPPEGYAVDFQNPQEQYFLEHILIFGFMGTLALVCLVQRLYTKYFLMGGLRADDCEFEDERRQLREGFILIEFKLIDLIAVAWVASVIVQSVQIWSILQKGLCHHVWEMSIEVYEKTLISTYIAGPIFILCNGLSKASLLMFYLRISNHRWFKAAIWTATAMVSAYTLVIAGLLLFGCRPIRAAWDPYASVGATCIPPEPLYIAMAVSNIVSDVVIFIIPIPTIATLKMPLAQKIGAAALFAIASLTLTTSIIRLKYLPTLLHSVDASWDAAPANLWSFVEVNLFIICGSMPTFRKFLKRFAPKWLGSWSSHRSKSKTYDLPRSRLGRQQRSEYSKFGDFEMDLLSFANGSTVEIRAGSIKVSHFRASADCAATAPSQDAVCRDIVSSNKGIACTRTFEVEYET